MKGNTTMFLCSLPLAMEIIIEREKREWKVKEKVENCGWELEMHGPTLLFANCLQEDAKKQSFQQLKEQVYYDRRHKALGSTY
jgi:hypothetical protein